MKFSAIPASFAPLAHLFQRAAGSRRFALALAAGLVAGTGALRAQVTWPIVGSGNIAIDVNFDASTTQTVSLAGFTLDDITFTSSTANYTFNGSGNFNLAGKIITNNSGANIVFSSGLGITFVKDPDNNIHTIDLATGSTVKIESNISQDATFEVGSMIKSGGGSLILSGANTFTGGISLNAGTLGINSAGALGTGALTISGGAIDNTSGSIVTVTTNNAQTWSGNFTFTGSNPLNLGTGNITLGGNRTVTVSASTLTLGGVIEDNTHTYSLTKAGAGTLVLTGDSGYDRGTTISGGTLQIGAGGSTGSIVGNITDNANLVFNRGNAYAFSGNISGTGTVSQIGAGNLTLSGTNTYAGATSVSGGGRLIVSSDANLGAAPGIFSAAQLSLNNGTLETTASFTLTGNRGVTLGSSGGTFNVDTGTTLNVAGNITGTGALTVQGGGGLTLNGSNSYSGATTINQGSVVTANVTNALPSATALAVNFGTLAVNASQTIAGISGTSGNVTIANSQSLTISSVTTNSSFSGPISGAGSLVKSGAGTSLTLSGNNTFAGGATINAGTLILANPTGSATGNGTVTVNSGASLIVGQGNATGGLDGNIVNNGTTTYNRSDDSIYGGVISGSGTAIKQGAGSLVLDGANTFTGTTTVNAGTLVVSKPTSLGATVAGTTVSGGAALFITNTTVGGEPVTLNGNGVSNTGALIGNGTASLSGAITMNTSATVGVPNSSDSFTLSGVIGEAGGTGRSLTKVGNGTLTLSGTNTYSGSTTISQGTLVVGTTNAIPSTSLVSVNSGAVFNVANNDTILQLTGSGSATIAAGKTLTLNTGGPLSTPISGAGNLAMNGVVTVTTNQTYTGTTTVNTTLTGGAATLNLGNSTTSGMVAGNIITTASNTGVQFNRLDDVTYAGVISGSGFLNKNNTDTVTLTGQNTYTGTTNISAGNLVIGTTNALPTTTKLSLSSGAVLDVANNQTVVGFASQSSGSTIKIESGKTLSVTLGNSSVTNSGFGTSYAGNITDGTAAGGALKIGGDTNPDGGHTVGLYGTNTYTGGTTIDPNGKLLLGNNGSTGSIVGNVVDNGLLIFNRGNAITFNGTISGNGTVAQGVSSGNATTGATTLTAANTYTGGTTVYSSDLILANPTGSATGTGTVTVNPNANLVVGNGGTAGSLSGNIANSGAVGFNHSDNITYNGVISGNGTLIKGGSGSLTLGGANTYTGVTQVHTGTLIIGATNTLPTSTLLSLMSGSTLDVASDQTIAGFTSATGAGATILLEALKTLTVSMPLANATTSFAGDVTGTGTFAVNGAGNDVVNLTGNVASTVATSVGTGATLNIAGGSVAGPIALNTGSSLNFNTGGSQTFNNVISGAGSLVSTSGTTTLTGSNTFTGGVTVNGGKIIVNNTSGSATGSGPVVINNGGIVGGSGFISGPLTLNTGGTVAPGNSPGTLTVGATTFAGGATFAFDINAVTGTEGTNWDYLNITGPLTITATNSNQFVISLTSLTSLNAAGLLANFDPTQTYQWKFLTSSGTITGFSAGAFQYNASSFQNNLAGGFFYVSQSANSLFLNFSPAAVPEPSTWALLATGLGALAITTLRRRRR